MTEFYRARLPVPPPVGEPTTGDIAGSGNHLAGIGYPASARHAHTAALRCSLPL